MQGFLIISCYLFIIFNIDLTHINLLNVFINKNPSFCTHDIF